MLGRHRVRMLRAKDNSKLVGANQRVIVLFPGDVDKNCGRVGHLQGYVSPARLMRSPVSMFSLLCIVSGVWVAVSGLFVLALSAAGRKVTPVDQTDRFVLKHAA